MKAGLSEQVRLLVSVKAYADAIGLCDAAIARETGAELADAWEVRAHVHRAMKANAAAIEDCTQGLRVDPKEQGLLFYRGWVLLDEGRYRDAAKDLRALLAIDDERGSRWWNRNAAMLLLAVCEKELGHAKAARDICDRLPKDCRWWAGGRLRTVVGLEREIDEREPKRGRAGAASSKKKARKRDSS